MIINNYVIGLCIYYTEFFIVILECILIIKTMFTVKQYAVLRHQQPHTTCI